MKLLKLPYLARNEILKQMEYAELFLLSFVSKRSMRMIQSVKRKEMKNIEIVTSGCFINIDSYNFCAGSDKKVIVTLYPETFESDETLRKEISLGNVVCSMEYERRKKSKRYSQSLIVYYFYSEMETLAMIFYNQLNALFGNYVTFSLNIQDEVVGYCSLPNFFNIKRSEMSLGAFLNAQVLENYFMNVQEQEYLSITIKELNGYLSPNSRFFNTQELDITCGEWYSGVDVLSLFKGRSLKLSTASDIQHKICPFISRWTSCRELKNFKCMSIFMESPGLTNIDGIKRKSGIKDLTPELNAFGPGKKFRFSSYIVRDDGIVAKMLIGRFFVFMEVQSFTEEQMLKGTEVSV